ncbi:MAG: DEAD/DEAH box helicase [Erythrobacter sp.]
MVATEISNLDPSADTVKLLESLDWNRLLLAGSILERSEEREHKAAALRIASAAITLGPEGTIRDAGAVLLEKLGNARAVSLASRRDLVLPELHSRLGIAQRLEAERRELTNSILLDATGKRFPVNRFQLEFWNGATRAQSWLSASAPTASGKTYLVSRWLIDTLLEQENRVAVYIAPTRALVTEVEEHLKQTLNEFPSAAIEVSSLPLRDRFVLSSESGSKVIFVLTQERLHLLANSLSDQMRIDLMVIDEAHKIGDSQRGVVLQDAIERASRENRHMRAVFVSPATKNPGELLEDAPDGISRISIESDTPTVLQNIIHAEQVPRKPREWILSLRSGDELAPLGTLNLASKPAGKRKQIAFIAAAAGSRGGTLVYANGADEAEKIAQLIAQLTEPVKDGNEELADLADLVRKSVHRKYSLAPLVEKGVAFHYGNMPSLVRLEIERLFRQGSIKFLVCTSTLIEGVNLSCRTIVVRNPRKGLGQPMEAHDFWNLAGRAGRWGNEFQGNIICVRPSDPADWPNGVPARAKYPIRRETDAVIGERDDLLEFLDTHDTMPTGDLKIAAKLEQVSAYLLGTFLREGSITTANLAKRHDARMIQDIDQRLARLASAIDLPIDLAIRHPGVSIASLQRLMNWFRQYEGDPEDLVPAPAESVDAFQRFTTVMTLVNDHLFPVFQPPGLIPLHVLIVIDWLKGLSLSTIIRKRIEYHERNNQTYQIGRVIRGTMELIEQTARFRAPKYLSAYMDVLKIHLRESGREDLIDEELDLGTALELGVSTKTIMSLMEFGLSRISAVALYEKIAEDSLDQSGCVSWLNERRDNLEALDLPKVVLREIALKVLGEALEAKDASQDEQDNG